MGTPNPDGSFGWIDRVVSGVIQRAARNAPEGLAERLQEEWSADVSERPGPLSRLGFALGCYWAATLISFEHCTVTLPATSSSMGDTTMAAYAHRGAALFSRRTAAATPTVALCDINITPLIDVMLVLLVTLIVSLPIMTHAVKLDLPQVSSAPPTDPPEVINLEIEFDGTIVWNNVVLKSPQQLESYLRAEAQKVPQPEIHLRPDRGVKYDFVAKVLAVAQHSRMQKMGFVNTGDFSN